MEQPSATGFFAIVEAIDSCRKSGDLDSATGILRKELPNDWHNVTLLSLLALTAIEKGDGLDQVKGIVNNIIVSDLLNKGDALLAEGRREEARRFYAAAADRPIVDDEPYRKLADLYRAGRHPTLPLDLYETPLGKYILPNNAPGDVIVKHMSAGRIFDDLVYGECARFIRPGTVVLDVGANFGQMSLLFSALVGDGGTVYSFEAQKFVFDVLNMNIAANGIANVRTFNVAVMRDSEGSVSFPAPDFSLFPSYGSFGVDEKRADGPQVKKLRIDDLKIGGEIGLMKIDIQGADLQAMQGARETIMRARMPIVFEYEKEYDKIFDVEFADYLRFMEEIGYKALRVIGRSNILIVPAEDFSRYSDLYGVRKDMAPIS